MSSSQTNHGLESTNCNRYWNLALIIIQRFSSQTRVKLGSKLNTVIVNLRSFLSLCERNVLLQEVTSQDLKRCFLLCVLSSSSCSSCCNECTLLKYSRAFSFSLLVIMNFRFNNNIILIEEIKLSFLVSTCRLITMVRNNSFCNFAIVFWVFFIQHNEKKIETG